MELFEEMEEKDTHLFSQLQTRKNAIIGLDFDIQPFSDDPRDKQIAKFIEDCIFSIESMEDTFLDLLDAIGKGFAVSEIMWGIDGRSVYVEEIKTKHQKNFFWDDQDIFKVIVPDNNMGIELPKNKFLRHKYKARSGHPARAGVIRVCAWMYLFKNYDVKDWVSFVELYGTPMRLGVYSNSSTEEDRNALMRAIVQLGADAAGIISEGTKIEILESEKSSSSDIYEKLANFCNAEMSKAILGQTLTSEVGSSGSYAASQTHNGVRQDLVEADCKALAQTIKRDLIKPLCLFNFGESRRLPWIKFHYEPPEDLKGIAETYSILVKDVNLPIAVEHLYAKFGIPEPAPGQQVVQGITAQLPLKNEVVVSNKATPDKKEFQRAVDALADSSLDKSLPILKKLFEPIQKLIESAGSYEELMQKLPEIYPELDTKGLEELLQRSMFIADMLGRMRENA